MSIFKLFYAVLLGSLASALISPVLAQGNFWAPTGHMGDSTINSLAFSPNNNVYAATNKGVYRSTDKGATWTNIGPVDSLISAVAAPVNGTVFAGTMSLFNGMLRTTDDGAHWTRLDLDTMTHLNPVTAIGVDASGNIIAGGVLVTYRSTDNGEHWSTSYLFQQLFGLSWITAIVPVPNGLVFAAHQSGVYRSTDGGISWELKITGLDDTTARAIGYDETGYVYAGIYGMGIYRSDNGNIWARSDIGVTNHLITSFASNPLDQVFTGTVGGGVFQTTDNGDSWVAANSGLTNLSVKCLSMSPEGYLYAGTSGGGVFRSQQSTTGLRKLKNEIPAQFELAQNYPNPFNPSTRISFSLPTHAYVKLEVFNLLGVKIATLISRDLSPGTYVTEWDASGFPSGVYIARLEAGDFRGMRKMILMR